LQAATTGSWAGVARPTTTNAGLTAATGNNSTNSDASAFTYINTFTATASSDTVYVSFIPDVAGSYSFLVSTTTFSGTSAGTDGTSNTSNPIYVAGDTNASFTVTTAGAPTGVTLTNVTGTTAYNGGGGTYGALIRVNLAGGVLTTDEVINVTSSAGYIVKATRNGNGTFSSGTPSSTSTAALNKSDFQNGVAFVNVLPTAASQTITVTATGSGSLAAITNTATVSSLAGNSADGATYALPITSWKARGGTAVTTGWSSATAQTTTDNGLTYPSTATSLSL